MATVYRGRHTTLGRDVAIKILHPHLSSTERNRIRFAREARAIEDMDHENILKIFDYSGVEASSCYIVTEFVDGMTLQELLNDWGRLPSEVATILGIKLSEALSYAHHKKIIHRDLKPENVMLSREGELKLMDFGIAHFLDEMHLTITGALVGSPAYMSPEQAMESDDLDHRSDLFSLGTLLFHLVSGQLPFSGSNPSIVLRNIIDGNRPRVMDAVPDISDRFAEVIERLLQTDPSDRIFSADDVAVELRAALMDVQLSPKEPAWSLQSWLSSPVAYQHRLSDHLSTTLMEVGKARLEQRDYLEAQGLFNRLLSIDEGNEEVLSLIQSMHSLHPEDDEPPPPTHRQRRWWPLLAAPLAAGVLTWVLWPSPTVSEPVPFEDPLLTVELLQTQERPPLPTEPSPGDAAEAPAENTPQEVLESPGAEEVLTPEPPPIEVSGPSPRPQLVSPPPRERPNRASIEEPEATPDVLPEALQPEAPGYVLVIIEESYGDIWIDGELKGRTGLIGQIEVSAGPHSLKVQNDYSYPVTMDFVVKPGEAKELTVDLQPLPARVGMSHLELASDCMVTVNGGDPTAMSGISGGVLLVEPQESHALLVTCPGDALMRCDVRATKPDNFTKPSCR